MSHTKKTRKSRYCSDKDAYYKRKYGRSESEVMSVLSNQSGGCFVCGAVGKTKALPLDHDHKIERWKVASRKTEDGTWVAWPRNTYGRKYPQRLSFTENGKTKSDALKKVKARLKRLSSRGLICWRDNAALKKLNDDPDIADRLAQYLRNYQAFLNGEQDSANGFTI